MEYSEREFAQRMRELGWKEQANLLVMRRFAGGKLDRLPALMSEVIAEGAEVIVTAGTQAALAAKKATQTTPVVAVMGDPVGTGLVPSLAQPGGNLTGVSVQNSEEIPSKWLQLIREVVPGMSSVAVLVNPDNPLSVKMLANLAKAAAGLGIKPTRLEARRTDDYTMALKVASERSQAVVITTDAVAIENRKLIANLAQQYHLPTIGGGGEFVEDGALIGYGPDYKFVFRRMADYTDKILRGSRPADLPIEQPTQFRLSVNLRTAKSLKLSIPQSILARADDVLR